MLKKGVTAIVDLAIEEPLPTIPRTTNYCRFTLTDDGENNPTNIRATVLATSAFIQGGHVIAICCNAGLNRSLSMQRYRTFRVTLRLKALSLWQP